MLWVDRLRATIATMRYGEAWTLPLPLTRSMGHFLKFTRPVPSPVGIVVHPYAPPIGGKAFRRYLQGLRRMARGEHVPLVAHISITDECGYSCHRCSNLAGDCPPPGACQIFDLIRDLKAAGTVCVAFTGGEPALRTDLPDLVAACGDEIAVTLFTSGQECDAARARLLRNAGLQLAFVSLDHYVAEIHDKARGRSGAFEGAIDAIRAFRSAGVYTAVQAVVGPELMRDGELEQFISFCSGVGAYEIMLLEPVAVRGQCTMPSDLDRERLANLHLRAARSARLPKVNAMSLLESPRCLGCQAGFSFLYVRTNGDVFPCDFAPITAGNAYTEGIATVLERLARSFPRPTSTCLALEMNGTGLAPRTTPVPLGAAGEMMDRRNLTPPPAAMSWLSRTAREEDIR